MTDTDAIVTEAGSESDIAKALAGLPVPATMAGRQTQRHMLAMLRSSTPIVDLTTLIRAIEAEAAQRALDDVRAKVERTTNDSYYGEGREFATNGYLLRSTVLRIIGPALQDRGADREDVSNG